MFEMGMTPAEDVRFHHRDSAALFSCAVVGTCSSDVFVVWRERACVRACVRACARATHDHRINRAAVMFVWVGEFVVALIS